jgi:DNA-binding transcriptional regulator WhiA
MNRVVNAENSNLRRAVAASRRQLEDIEVLAAHGQLKRLSPAARRVARARQRAPEATFSEIAAALDLSRAQVQRAFAQIEAAALHDEDTD